MVSQASVKRIYGLVVDMTLIIYLIRQMARLALIFHKILNLHFNGVKLKIIEYRPTYPNVSSGYWASSKC
ncbi:hypothetical protein BSQ40_08005 [Serratia fonticola]|nr:hypothetical protein BSQ40_08005 [Serratia fonticola]